MAEIKKFPSWRWHPETGEGRVFNTAEEVPEGWLDKHPNHFDGSAPPPKSASVVTPLARDEIIAALNQGQVEFKKNAGTKALYDQLCVALRAFLTERNITTDDAMDGRVLLELVGKAAAPQE